LVYFRVLFGFRVEIVGNVGIVENSNLKKLADKHGLIRVRRHINILEFSKCIFHIVKVKE